MNKSEIDAFLAVVEYDSISRAAEKLFIRQSTLSGRIKKLEDGLSAILFNRGRGIRGLELTDQGKDFVPIAEKWKQLWQEALAIADKPEHRLLGVAAVHSINTYVMPKVYSLFSSQNPDVHLRLLMRHSDQVYPLIEGGLIEAAIITKPRFSKTIETTALFSEKMVLVHSEHYPLQDKIHPSELNPNKEVFLDWYAEFVQWHEYWFGANSTPKVFTDDMSIMERFLQKENCWSIMPISIASVLQHRSPVQVSTLTQSPPDRQVFIAKHNKAKLSDELNQLLEHTKNILTKISVAWKYPLQG